MRLPLVVLFILTAAMRLGAQAQSAPATTRFEISDNSFLVEEAFNQEQGIFQNIFNFIRSHGGRWDAAFTQEWPVGGERHQLSYTIPFTAANSGDGFGDVLINYRAQVLKEDDRTPAFSPRVSIILPDGRQQDGLGNGVVGWQVNLPVSKQFGNLYVHANAGVTYSPGVHYEANPHTPPVTLVSPSVAASSIVRVRPMLNVMCEVVAVRNETLVSAGATRRLWTIIVSPGFRGGWNIASKQVIVGAALPVTFAAGTALQPGVLGYFSYELPFRRAR